MAADKPPLPGRRPARSRWRWAPAGLALVAVLSAIAWLVQAEQSGRQDGAILAPASAAPGGAAHAAALTTAMAPAPALAMTRAQLRDNVQLTEHTYCSYLQSSRYPHGSRPIGEQPDQVYPNAPINDSHAMRSDGGGSDPAVLIQTSQTRVYLAAGEAVSFSIRAVDADGKVLPLVITGSTAQGLNFGKQRPLGALSLPFVDDGSGADPVAGDGAFAATLAPAQTALAGFDGTIRTRVNYSVNGKNGSVLFDIIYSPALPALWTGPAREIVDNGSLSYSLPVDVRQAGRYLVSGRVDDARGKPFALVNFNDVLSTGPHEIRLTVFGKLLRDQAPALPLTLRDVDGYLLKENTDPDRALMPRLEGRVATGKARALNEFSTADWDSEEKSRHLAEFAKDARAARDALARFDPSASLPPPACALPE